MILFQSHFQSREKSFPSRWKYFKYYIFSNIGSLLKVGSVAEQLKKNSPERYPLQLLVWILGQLAGIGIF